MAITFKAVRAVPKTATASIQLVTVEAISGGLAPVAAAELDTAGFEGKAGETHISPDGTRVVGLVGIGEAADVDSDAVRVAGATAARTFGRYTKLGLTLPSDVDIDESSARQALVEGIALASYQYTDYKSESQPSDLRRVDIAGGTGAAKQGAVDRGVAIADAQMLARDFVNTPGGDLTPAVFARRTAAAAKKSGLTCKVWDEAAIKKAKLGGLLGVNRGSTQAPRFVELTYTPKSKPQGTLAFVGKGITFDAGGLSIKTGAGMMTMKCDMGGAAAVIGAMTVLPALGVKCRVRAFVPMTDNMLGGDATRPGDVLKIRNGKTIEVLNTDAEGRLVLADALSLASEAKPDAIVDLATLTGACLVALGPKIAGLMGNDDSWIAQIEAASERSGDRVWHLPLPADYAKQFESPIADMKNIGTPHGGALTAGLILKEFVDDNISWAHIDIAGPAWSEASEGEITKGGTGFGVRLLAELAQQFSKP